jgi:TerB N-terminal domain/TerB-C domain
MKIGHWFGRTKDGLQQKPDAPVQRQATQKPRRPNSPPPPDNSAQPSGGARPRPTIKSARTPQPANRTRTAAVAQVRTELSAQDLQRILVERYPNAAGLKATRKVVPDDGVWVPPGQLSQVATRSVPGGAFYIGTALSAVDRYGSEPSLVNTSLPADFTQPDWKGSTLNYWPSYADISPGERAAYLTWLSSDRNWPEMPIGFVFIYFYGFERRALADKTDRPGELPWIRSEVQRLLRIYGSDPSFKSYAERFISAVECLLGPAWQSDPPEIGENIWTVPDSLKVGLGRIVANGQPVPCKWAFAWLLSDPQSYLRTPAHRCREEFARLFAIRYQEKYGEGLKIKRNKTRLEVTYYPASRSLGATNIEVGELPDVTALHAPLETLRELARECTDALDPFSRWLGRHPEDARSLAGMALLPAALVGSVESKDMRALLDSLERHLGEDQECVIAGEQLIGQWPGGPKKKLSRSDSLSLCELLSKNGYGVEPDVRFGGPPLNGGDVVLFRQPEPAGPMDGWRRVAATLDLASASIGPTDDGARSELADQLVQSLGLTEDVRPRVGAHLRWHAHGPQALNLAKRALADESYESRQRLGQSLVGLVTQRGTVGPSQVAGLTAAYGALGLEPASMFNIIHENATAPASGPIEIRPAGRPVVGEAIPPPPPSDGGRVRLDPAVVAATMAQSERARALLGDIFVDDEPLSLPGDAPASPGELTPPYRDLLHTLVSQPSWSPADFAAVAEALGLMPSGAIEVLNDAALDVGGELLLEEIESTQGSGLLEVNRDMVKELLG